MSAWGSNRYAPLSEWYSGPTKRDRQQDQRMAGLERKLDALLKGRSQPPAVQHNKETNKNSQTQNGKTLPVTSLCTEKPTEKTVWICNECACPHDNAKKIVCRFCRHKRVIPSVVGEAGAPPSSDRASNSASADPRQPAANAGGPITKNWAIALLRKRGAGALSPADVPTDHAVAHSSLSPATSPASTLSALESKRLKLAHSIEVTRDAGASDSVIAALQAELDALVEPKVGEEEMDQGKLLQLRAKQQAHHQHALATLTQELSAVKQQIDVLSAKASQIQDATARLEKEHESNLHTIDQAIANSNARPSCNSAPPQPTTAQVVSQSLQEALQHQDFCGADPQTAEILRLFSKKVVEIEAVKAVSPVGGVGTGMSHFASCLPSSGVAASSAPMPSTSSLGADMEMSEDGNDRTFVGISG